MFKQTKKIFLALGLGGISFFFANQVSAQQAYASGSSTITLINGASMSVGAEVSAPGGTFFGVLATPSVSVDAVISTATDGLDDNDAVISTLTVDPGALVAAPAGSSFTAQAALELGAAGAIDEVVSIIRAGAGVDGLD